ncbi:MAG TPA: peptidylprolyl isomerase [Candidatus Limnocylindrales bacterium]|nr:peptidylprolyl isomerase [Candidatus Limnocylindrales bacterium]
MTSRAKPTRSRTWDDRERRNMLLNIGFGLTIVAALLLLVVAWGVSWYGDHLAPAGSVNGQTITKDAWAKQVAINEFRADYQLRRIRTQLASGQMGASDAETRQAIIQQRLGQIDAISLEQLIDGTIQAELATKQGVTIAPADIDARFTEEATTSELRHAWMIAVKPELEEGKSVPTDAAVAAAKAKADQALADLRAGKDWDTIAKSVSTDATKDKAGDLGFLDENTQLDAAFVEALMGVAKDTPTEVIEGADDVFRVGRVTEIVAPVEDATLGQQVTDAGISMDDFRAALGRDVTRTKLSDAVLAQYLAPAPQRQVSQILLSADIDPSSGAPTGKEALPGAVKIRHILYSPAGDAAAAASLAPDDPAWKAAEEKANATYQKLQANPAQFAEIAKSDSDDGGSASRGGTYWFSKDDGLLQPFADAIFKDGLQPGQLLTPVKTTAGWHVIQILHFAPDTDWIETLRTRIDAGTLSFADAARDNSDGAGADQGGDIGWVGKGQLDETREAAIFAAPLGKVSEVLTVADVGTYLFLVSKEETREPDAEQRATLENSAFPTWYSKQKAEFDIQRDDVISGVTS